MALFVVRKVLTAATRKKTVGAWGHKTFESDDACEMFSVTLDIISRRCVKTLRRKDRRAYNEQRAAAQVLDMIIAMRELGPDRLAALLPSNAATYDDDVVAAWAAIKRLDDILKDEDYLDGQSNPRALRDQILKEKAKLEKRVRK